MKEKQYWWYILLFKMIIQLFKINYYLYFEGKVKNNNKKKKGVSILEYCVA